MTKVAKYNVLWRVLQALQGRCSPWTRASTRYAMHSRESDMLGNIAVNQSPEKVLKGLLQRESSSRKISSLGRNGRMNIMESPQAEEVASPKAVEGQTNHQQKVENIKVGI
jgi:hypothetical protein